MPKNTTTANTTANTITALRSTVKNREKAVKKDITDNDIDSDVDNDTDKNINNDTDNEDIITGVITDSDDIKNNNDNNNEDIHHTEHYQEIIDSKNRENKAVEVFSPKNGYEVETKGVRNFGAGTKDIPDRVVPMRTIYAGRKLSVSKSRMWLLQAFASLSLGELQGYRQRYSKELSIDETEVIELLLRSQAGDMTAKTMVWDLQKEIFKTMKTVYVEELKKQRSEQENAKNSRLADMLEEIGSKILESEGDNNR